ncbi:hypothetical protein [Methylorubrum salsuginis]|uniref:Uncharacterized protein n=1 Tax=Methylorubrum salsuginis TaxID=414703 RepID=A0A1I4A1D1_9HYPH|nr:hypothetical protein [Methylorubrum salsuginis]SFK50184.1 hypothetical protein SAMN04488125_102200 [Methylorubrum salsuginis]
MRGLSLIGAAFLCFVAPAAGWAQQIQTVQRVAPSGRPQQVQFIARMEPDCRSLPMDNLAILEGPAHGRISMERGVDFPNFSPNNPRSRCNTRKVPGNKLVYQSAPGFVGEDGFVLEVIGKYGNAMRTRYQIAVR